MFSRLRNQLGTAGLIVAIVALVAALAGGAIAATGGGGKASASKQGKQGKTGKTGKTGATGPAGPAGPKGDTGAAGPKGDNGAAGANGAAGGSGTAGANGKTVLSGIAAPTGTTGSDGDFYIKTGAAPEIYGPKTGGAWGSPTPLKGDQGAPGSPGAPGAQGPPGAQGAQGAQGPQGPPGDPWTAGGTLPAEETETGVWSFVSKGTNSEEAFEIAELVPVSFMIPLENGIAADNAVTGPSTNCPGTTANPEAEPGYFCVYTGEITGAFLGNGTFGVPPVSTPAGASTFPGGPAGTGKTGAVINIWTAAASSRGAGTWAVTAP